MPYSDEEHAALLKAAREEAAEQARQSVTTELTEAHNKIDTLEAEKAAAERAKEEAEKKAADAEAKAEQEKLVAKRKGERVKAMQALAGDTLDESYFNDERVERWAEMADDQFEGLINDFAEAQLASVGTTKEEAVKLAGLTGADRRNEIASILDAHRTKGGAEVRRETAAFRGGAAVGGGNNGSGGGSALEQLGHALR